MSSRAAGSVRDRRKTVSTLRAVPVAPAVLGLAIVGVAAGAAAQASPEPPAETFERDIDLTLERPPPGYLEVVDSFDRNQDLDVDVGIRFTRSLGRGFIEREDGRAGRFRRAATHRRRSSTLDFRVDVGLVADVALRFRVPVILNDVRELNSPDGADADSVSRRLSAPVPGTGGEQPLFQLPFQSPDRSGIPHVELGLAWSPVRQGRSEDVPTIVFLLLGRFAVSEPMGACQRAETVDPDTTGPVVETQCREGRETGIGDGTHGLRAELRTGWQTRYVAPYGGVSFDARWPARSRGRFIPGGDLPGYAQTRPPWEVGVTAGSAFVPWRDPERSQRIEVDARATARYVTAGHEYTPLFDALGTSSHPGLSGARPPCVGCAGTTPFEGLTDQAAHARIGGGLHFRLQAARYVRFVIGFDASWATPHLLTGTPVCHQVGNAAEGDPRRAGCPIGSITDPHHRSVIDLPGHRFRLVDDVAIDLYAAATARF